MSDNRQLNVVDENDEIVGVETREDIHKKGFLHREVHILFYTPAGDLIFQHRAKDKDTQPNKFDATVGGHVEIGSDYLGAALQEMREETGIVAKPEDLLLAKKVRVRSYDEIMHVVNDVFRSVYFYKYSGEIKDLKIEEGKSQGFVHWPLAKFLTLSQEERGTFVNSLFDPEYDDIYRQLEKIINQ
jgi:isopentenyldiphosphate isomerase